jgi:hypothetical protein
VEEPTVPAFPHHFFAPFKNFTFLNIAIQSPVPLFVCHFNFGNQLKCIGHFLETFFFGNPGKFRIKICPFLIFAIGCSFQVFQRVPIIPAGKDALISTIPPSRNLKKRLACSFSLTAVSAKMAQFVQALLFWPDWQNSRSASGPATRLQMLSANFVLFGSFQ